jgi:hypothetical protein
VARSIELAYDGVSAAINWGNRVARWSDWVCGRGKSSGRAAQQQEAARNGGGAAVAPTRGRSTAQRG